MVSKIYVTLESWLMKAKIAVRQLFSRPRICVLRVVMKYVQNVDWTGIVT